MTQKCDCTKISGVRTVIVWILCRFLLSDSSNNFGLFCDLSCSLRRDWIYRLKGVFSHYPSWTSYVPWLISTSFLLCRFGSASSQRWCVSPCNSLIILGMSSSHTATRFLLNLFILITHLSLRLVFRHFFVSIWVIYFIRYVRLQSWCGYLTRLILKPDTLSLGEWWYSAWNCCIATVIHWKLLLVTGVHPQTRFYTTLDFCKNLSFLLNQISVGISAWHIPDQPVILFLCSLLISWLLKSVAADEAR